MTAHSGIATTVALGMLAALALASSAVTGQAHAEEGEEEESLRYNYAEGLRPVVTFEFRYATETLEFPIFIMEDDYVANRGSPSFTLRGTADNSPHLYRALDEAFKYRQSLSFDWNYKYFDVYVDFVADGGVVDTLRYHKCKIEDYGIFTIDDDYESYQTGDKVGFAILGDIEFLCAGLNFAGSKSPPAAPSAPSAGGAAGFEPSYPVAEDIRTFVTFHFDGGDERIEYPVFRTESGFEESTARLTPEFRVEGLVTWHPMLSESIDRSRGIRGIPTSSSPAFDATVEFVQGGVVLRAIEYADCRVSSYRIESQFDKEEGFTGKRGFAVAEKVHVRCPGMEGVNPRHSDVFGAGLSWHTRYLEYDAPMRQHEMSDNVRAFATFEFDHGRETSHFPEFDQGDLLAAANPTFTLTGLVGDHPQLYDKVDGNLAVQFTTGANNFVESFDVTVEIIRDGDTVRAFEYRGCRVVDYVVNTEEDNEASYFKLFALTNEFHFECVGYHPSNPAYDALFRTDKHATKSSMDYMAEQAARGGGMPRLAGP